MKKQPLILAIILTLLISSCSIYIPTDGIRTGEIQTFTIHEPLPGNDTPVQLTINMAAGELQASPGAQGWVNGTIEYNVEDLIPVVTSGEGSLTIAQNLDNNFSPFVKLSNYTNKWNLQLGQVPMNLTLNAGAYKASMELGGLPISNLVINDGASDVAINFAEPNPVSLDQFQYTTGASTVRLTGLGNANISEMNFYGGAGTYTLDFTGTLAQDAQVKIEGGVGNITIIIPQGVASRITITGGPNNVSTTGTWTTLGAVYSTAGEGPTITINLAMSLGNLELISR